MFTSLAVTVYTFFIIVAMLFQFALAMGMPWGKLSMGGKYAGRFPPQMRIAALIQILVLAFLAAIVLTRAGVLFPGWFTLSKSLIWAVVGFGGISVVLNVITPSKWERILWAPVTIAMLASSIIIATN